jgi:hypothetical protein
LVEKKKAEQITMKLKMKMKNIIIMVVVTIEKGMWLDGLMNE